MPETPETAPTLDLDMVMSALQPGRCACSLDEDCAAHAYTGEHMDEIRAALDAVAVESDVPTDLLDLAREAMEDAGGIAWTDELTDVLAAVLPAHEAMVRAEVAEEIEEYFREKVNDVAINDHADAAITDRAWGMYRAARIARGEQP